MGGNPAMTNGIGGLSSSDRRELLQQKLREKIGDFQSLYPLSVGQQALWFLHELAPESAAYNIMCAARINSALDIPRLRLAFQALADCHAGLRTTYRAIQGKPVQLVHKHIYGDFEVIEASTWSQEELDSRLLERADAPIDIKRGVMRVTLFTRTNGADVLLLVLHHIAIDFWSLDLIIQDLAILYSMETPNALSSLSRTAGSYADFVRWQKALLDSQQGERLWNYWRKQLDGDLPFMNLYTDRPRPLVQTYEGESQRLELNEDLSRRLKQIANDQGATIFTAVLGAFKVLLQRYTDQDDIIVATPTIGRSHPELEGVVGYFSNPIMLRSRFFANLGFEEFLRQLRQTVISGLEHQDYPFPTLVERLGIKRDPSRSPVFQVMFMWDKGKWYNNRQVTGGLELEPFDFGQRGAPFDLTLTIVEKETTLTAIFVYNVNLFDADTISRLAGHFRVLLEGIVADPSRTIMELPLLTEAEMRHLLVDWNNTAKNYPRYLCVHRQIALQAKNSPHAIAVVFGNRQLTYSELNRQANQLARRLQSMGVGRNGLVGVMVERSMEMVVAILGVLKAGGAYVPMDPGYPRQRLDLMLSDSRPSVLLTQRKLVASLPNHGAQMLCLDSDWANIAQESDAEPASHSRPDDLAYVIYTSGSTGGPKGVKVSHGAFTNFLTAMKSHFSSDDVLVAVTTLSFDIAALEIFAPLIIGARTVIVSPPVAANGVALAESLTLSGATTMQATPTTWRLLLEAGWKGGARFKALCGGEALPQSLANRLLDCCGSLWNLYGPTETTIWSTVYKVDRGNRGTVPIGRPIANTQIYILNSTRRPVPIGVPGELYIGGDGVSEGYLNHPDLTAEKFVPDPFNESPKARLYKSGDLARYLPDGNIEFLGRLDHQVKVNGHRIELHEIEAQLLQHPSVREAAVSVLGDEAGVRRLLAYIVVGDAVDPPGANLMPKAESEAAAAGADLTISELRSFLKRSLPHYMLPASYVFKESLPLTPNGKLDRKALPAPEVTRPELAEEYVAPRNDLERRLAAAWARVLKLDRVGIEDNFFDLGGASLKSMEVVVRLKEAGLTITPEMLFEHQTVAKLASAIEAGASSVLDRNRADGSDLSIDEPLIEDAEPVRSSDSAKNCNLVIESLGVYLPERSVSTKDVLRGCRKKVLFPLERMTGIKTRRFAGENEFSIDLAKKSVADCLRKSKYGPEHIELLVCCNVSRCDAPDRFSYEPSTSVRLREFFGFENALTFDVSNACAGMFTAIIISEALIKIGAIRCAMVVSGEYISHLAESAQKEIDGFMDSRLACLTVGDAGAAIILERSPHEGVGFQEIDMYTLGKYSLLCIAKITEKPHGGAIMYTDSINQTTVAAKNAVMHGTEVMRRCGWSPEGFDRLIMHQTSEMALRDVARALNNAFGRPVCHDGNTVYNLAERGNTASTTHFVALRDLILKGEMKSSEKVVFGISGSGQTVGTALYIFDDLPDRLRCFDSTEARPPKLKTGELTCTRHPQLRQRVRIAALGTLERNHQLGRNAIKLARAAAENCLQNSSYGRDDIELMIHAGVFRNDFLAEPAIAALLAGELQINDDIVSIEDRKSFAFDIFNGAVGFLNACYVASALIQAQRFSTAMVVASEIENNIGIPFKALRGIEETGGAVILDAAQDGKTGFGHFVFKCETDYINALTAYTAREGGQTFLLFKEDEDIQDHYLDCIQDALGELLALESLDVSQIAAVIGPQIAQEFSARLSNRLGISRDKFVDVARGGKDLFTCAIPYSLHWANHANKIAAGDIGLIICVGSGIQVGCAVYYF